MSDISSRRPVWSKILGIAALAALGGGTGYAFATYIGDVASRWDDALALLMAVSLLGMGVLSAGVMATRPSDMPRGCGLLQLAVLLLAGVMFALPIVGPRFVSPDLIFVLIVILLAIQSLANVLLWRAADEMLRRVMAETSALAFWALQTALFVYAAAERLGLIEGVTAWGMTGILMGVYLAASIIASARRGIR